MNPRKKKKKKFRGEESEVGEHGTIIMRTSSEKSLVLVKMLCLQSVPKWCSEGQKGVKLVTDESILGFHFYINWVFSSLNSLFSELLFAQFSSPSSFFTLKFLDFELWNWKILGEKMAFEEQKKSHRAQIWKTSTPARFSGSPFTQTPLAPR